MKILYFTDAEWVFLQGIIDQTWTMHQYHIARRLKKAVDANKHGGLNPIGMCAKRERIEAANFALKAMEIE